MTKTRLIPFSENDPPIASYIRLWDPAAKTSAESVAARDVNHHVLAKNGWYYEAVEDPPASQEQEILARIDPEPGISYDAGLLMSAEDYQTLNALAVKYGLFVETLAERDAWEGDRLEEGYEY